MSSLSHHLVPRSNAAVSTSPGSSPGFGAQLAAARLRRRPDIQPYGAECPVRNDSTRAAKRGQSWNRNA